MITKAGEKYYVQKEVVSKTKYIPDTAQQVIITKSGALNTFKFANNSSAETDKVSHPAHYTFGTIEVIDVIDDWKLGTYEANIIKYVARYKYKNGITDLRKAKWYLDRLISNVEKEATIVEKSERM